MFSQMQQFPREGDFAAEVAASDDRGTPFQHQAAEAYGVWKERVIEEKNDCS